MISYPNCNCTGSEENRGVHAEWCESLTRALRLLREVCDVTLLEGEPFCSSTLSSDLCDIVEPARAFLARIETEKETKEKK